MATKIGGDPLLKVKSNKNLIPPTSESKGLGGNSDSKSIIDGNSSTATDKTVKRKNDPKVSNKPSSDEVSNDIGVSAPLVNAIDPNIKGGGIDSEGRFRTPYGQIVDAITKPNDYSDDRPLDVIAAELEAAKELDNELSFEQQKAQVLTSYTQPTGDTPDPTVTMQVSDLENEVNQTVAGDGSGSPVDDVALTNLLNSYKGKPVKYGEAAIERLGLEEYYPDINTPLQVGTYSGSIVGNNPIFVGGGGYFPFSVLDARKRAMETAAANRVAQAEKIKELFIVPTAEQYQDQLTEYGLSLYSDLGEAAGWDYNAMTDMSTEQGRRATKAIQNYRSNALRFTAINSMYEKNREEWKGEKYIPASAWQTMNDWKSGAYNIEYLMEHPEEMEKIERDMISYDNMTKDARALKGTIDYTVSPAANPEGTYTEAELAEYKNEVNLVMDHKNYDILRTTEFKYIPMSRIMAAVDQQVDYGHYSGNPEQVKKDMTAYITSLVSEEWNNTYMEASNRSTNITVNNDREKPDDVSIWKDIVNKSNDPTFRTNLGTALSFDGDPKAKMDRVDFVFGNGMGLEPIKDTKYIDGVYPLGAEMNAVHNVPMSSLEIQDKNGNWVKLSDWQVSKAAELGISGSNLELYKRSIVGQGLTETQLQQKLGEWGIPPNEALLLSKGSNSTVQGGLSERIVSMAYDDENGRRQYMTYDSGEQKGMYAYNHDYYEVFIGDETFAGFTVRAGYNPNFTTTAAVMEGQSSSTSSGLERGNDYGNSKSTNSMNIEADNSAPVVDPVPTEL